MAFIGANYSYCHVSLYITTKTVKTGGWYLLSLYILLLLLLLFSLYIYYYYYYFLSLYIIILKVEFLYRFCDQRSENGMSCDLFSQGTPTGI